jgi:hypothetical protein
MHTPTTPIDLSATLAQVAQSARDYHDAPARLIEWARKEQAKVTDPKARSYSIVARYFILGGAK